MKPSFLLHRAAQRGLFGKCRTSGGSTITDALFVYLDGRPNAESIAAVDRDYRHRPLVCLTSAWEDHIRKTYPHARVFTRTLMTPASHFILNEIPLPEGYVLAPFDQQAFDLHPFGHGENYADFADFQAKGAGAVIWYGGEIVAAVSSFLTIDKEIELDVSTAECHRGKGLASACISLMLRECTQKGITVHWDAQNDISRHLAEKFGFTAEYTYSVYWLPQKEDQPMLTFKNLEGVTDAQLYQTFDESFRDYPVDLGFDEAALKLCLDRRSCEAIHSYGAFEGDEMIAFASNAVRMLDGDLTAYVALTGVSIHHRRKGAGKGMLLAAADHFRQIGARRFLLEVIDTNEKAYNLYKAVGFRFSRKLDSYAMPKTDLPVKHEIRTVTPDDALWAKLRTFWDHTPTWQNDIDSVKAVQDAMLVAVAYENDEPVGYVVCGSRNCDIAQIAVAPDHRRKGIGTGLLAYIMQNTPSEKVSISNVDDRSGTLAAFLVHHGFRISIILHELEKSL